MNGIAMKYRCIMFDLDDTLWACKPVIKRAEELFYRWSEERHAALGRRYTQEKLIESRVAFMRDHPEWHHNLTHLRKQWLTALAQECDLGDDFVEEGFQVYWLARNEVSLFAGVADMLMRLKQRYVVGSITNGNADVSHIGIDHLFDFSVTSIEAGVAKPHPEIFALAAEKANTPLEHILHVGDDWQRDVQGALAAGAHAAWVKTAPQETDVPDQDGPAPTHTVVSVLELEAMLGESRA